MSSRLHSFLCLHLWARCLMLMTYRYWLSVIVHKGWVIKCFLRFFQNPKNMTLRIFELLHTFSRTLQSSSRSMLGFVCEICKNVTVDIMDVPLHGAAVRHYKMQQSGLPTNFRCSQSLPNVMSHRWSSDRTLNCHWRHRLPFRQHQSRFRGPCDFDYTLCFKKTGTLFVFVIILCVVDRF